jgi:hypothetical protein
MMNSCSYDFEGNVLRSVPRHAGRFRSLAESLPFDMFAGRRRITILAMR